jgi:putative NADH-flavin reductase
MRIAVIGASGWLGGTVAREAIGRGHDVTGREAGRLPGEGDARVLNAAGESRITSGH